MPPFLFYFVERRGGVVAGQGKQSTASLSTENWLPIPAGVEQKPAPREGYLLSSGCSTLWAVQRLTVENLNSTNSGRTGPLPCSSAKIQKCNSSATH